MCLLLPRAVEVSLPLFRKCFLDRPNREFPLEVLDGPFIDQPNCTFESRVSNCIGHKQCVRVHLPYSVNQSRLGGPCTDHQMQQSVASLVAASHLTKKKRKESI